MPDEVWASFTRAGFTCWAPQPVTVRPAPPGSTTGPFPFDGPVAFVTADNPQGRQVPDAENVAARSRLAAALDDQGLRWVPALGGDPDGDHREPGAVILGIDVAVAARLGARFDQAAVYVWTAAALHLVACALDRHDVLGFTAAERPSVPPPPSLRAG